MSAMQQRKNKIVLSDYNYRRDIENRLLTARLSTFEVEVLREILNGSLKFSLKQLADNLNCEIDDLLTVVDKFAKAKLIKREGDLAFVDKEMRKYYESQILKFDEDFEPGMEFLQNILHKVPIQVLPVWYAIPRTSDHIFQAILEKFLYTPKLYERYLQELQFDNPLLQKIAKDVFTSPDFKVKASVIMANHDLTHEVFEECLLLLEYNLVCCLGYELVDGHFEEIVTPFSEWHEYLRFRRDTNPKTITDIASIKRLHNDDFGFIKDMSRVLKPMQKKAIPLVPFANGYTIAPKEAAALLPDAPSEQYIKNIVDKLIMTRLGEIREQQLFALESSHEWMKKSNHDKALTLTRHPIHVEKGLKRILHHGWVYMDDYLKGFTGSLATKDQIALKNKGKRWRYTPPIYTAEDMVVIERTLYERLFEAGIVAVGTHQGRRCIYVTPFGNITLED